MYFAGTDVGPFVFVVSEEKWYPMFGGEAAMFNTTAIEYVSATNTVRFGTWGSGIWDFTIDDGTPSLIANTVNSSNSTCDSLLFTWSTNIETSVEVRLLKGSTLMETWNVADGKDERFAWLIPDGYTIGSDYKIEIEGSGIIASSNTFSISASGKKLGFAHMSVDYVDSEHSASRLASLTIDGDESTFWHTEWSPNTPGFPHTIVYQMDTIAEWKSFSYLARQDGSANGRIADYKIYGSTDNVNWTELKSGTLANSASLQTIDFDVTMECEYIKFEALSEVTSAFYASMSEFGLYYVMQCDVVTNSEQELTSAGTMINSINRGRLLNIDAEVAGEYTVRVTSMNGKLLHVEDVNLSQGENNIQLPSKLRNAKLVVVSLTNGKVSEHKNLFIRN